MFCFLFFSGAGVENSIIPLNVQNVLLDDADVTSVYDGITVLYWQNVKVSLFQTGDNPIYLAAVHQTKPLIDALYH